MSDVLVIGQIARDLALLVDELPEPGRSGTVRERREMLGGKGANQAVALAQLGASVSLLGVIGDDGLGDRLLAGAAADGIDVRAVSRRPHSPTGLIVDLVDDEGRRRYLEDLPASVRLTEDDLASAADTLVASRAVLVQLQQPPEVVAAAVRAAHSLEKVVVVDGVPPEAYRSVVLAGADVLRADAHEAELLAGGPIPDPDAARRVAGELLRHGPELVVLAVSGQGNQFVWPDGELFLPLVDTHVVDPTGAGDAFVAALTVATLRGADPRAAAQAATEAAAATVGRLGGRPDLPADLIEDRSR